MFLNDDKYLEVWNYPEITDYLNDLRRCVIKGDIDGFDEIIVKYGQLIQDLTLQINKKIVIPDLV